MSKFTFLLGLIVINLLGWGLVGYVYTPNPTIEQLSVCLHKNQIQLDESYKLCTTNECRLAIIIEECK